jgi:hypothetical protein
MASHVSLKGYGPTTLPLRSAGCHRQQLLLEQWLQVVNAYQ